MMSFLQQLLLILLSFMALNCIINAANNLQCIESSAHLNALHFSLIRRCQRSKQHIIELENTQNLEECFKLAKRVKGLALNYAPVSRRNNDNEFSMANQSYKVSHGHFWQQAEEFFNCHVLQCPENSTYKTLVNDSRFDYFSLYGRPPVSKNYSCVPEVGIFQINTLPSSYFNASKMCLNQTGVLAHIVSANRTAAIAKLLNNYNEGLRSEGNGPPRGSSIHLAYVGLNFNRTFMRDSNDFRTTQNESLKCYLYRAWAPGHPREGGAFMNTSCVAISTARTWVTVDCERNLPFICEIYTSKLKNDYEEDSYELAEDEFDECPMVHN